METGLTERSGESASTILTFEEVGRRRRETSAVVVDVLPRESFQQAHIAGAVNLPLAQIPERALQVLPDPAREIIVYCGSFT